MPRPSRLENVFQLFIVIRLPAGYEQNGCALDVDSLSFCNSSIFNAFGDLQGFVVSILVNVESLAKLSEEGHASCHRSIFACHVVVLAFDVPFDVLGCV